jgi:hypothetical protein
MNKIINEKNVMVLLSVSAMLFITSMTLDLIFNYGVLSGQFMYASLIGFMLGIWGLLAS